FCLIGLTGCSRLVSNEKMTAHSTQKQAVDSSSSNSEKMEKEEQIEISKDPINEAIKTLLKEFGKKWLNYTDVYERNQSVKAYLTDRCVKENGIEDNPHVQYKAIGRIHNVTQDVAQPNHYLLFGEETTNEVTRFVLIQLKIDQQVKKIDAIKVYYVRSV
ncbi:EF0163 family protein, partial [Enterococcus gallinarum]|uniref:EF0163 family protein n=2 Tax=Enterococcus gallinarum TaxID=1353 RepID=UPI000B010867